MTDALALADLPTEIQEKITAALSCLPTGWQLARIAQTADQTCIVADIADETGRVVAQEIVLLPTPDRQ